MNRLLDKVAIITGADGGICHKASQFFCEEGAKVVMCDIDPNVLKKCAKIVENGGQAVAVVGDVSKKETWEILLKTALDNFGKVDIVVNGAAMFSTGENRSEWDTMTLKQLHSVLDNNIDSLLWSYQVVLKYMIDNGIRGNFLNFASSTAFSWNGSGCSGYPISKAAVYNATHNMVKQVSPTTGIRFNCLAPNYVKVPKTAYLYKSKPILASFKATTPFPNLGEPADAAWAIVYLCSDEAKYINGICLPVDGGWLACN